MASDIRLEVAVPCPLRNLFTYKAPEALAIEAGRWVEVPFGRRRVLGLVMAAAPTREDTETGYAIKSVWRTVDQMPPVDTDLLELIQWSIRYYHAVPWDVVSTLVPTTLLQRQATIEKHWQLYPEPNLDVLKRAPRRQALVAWMAAQGAVTDADICRAGFTAALRRELVKLSLVQQVEIAPTAPQRSGPVVHQVRLNQEQQQAVKAVALQQGQTYLLQGPTGSGKTEVYLELARRAIDAGQQVLLLVPEIGLTPQIERRLRDALDARIATYHSDMPDSERRQVWLHCLAGRLDLIIGTRSAVFLPFTRLGLIVLDEEHDSSYKQQEGWRYHARQIAAIRARQLAIPLVLGSATPSLDSLLNLERGRYQSLPLRHRHERRPLPQWQVASCPGDADLNPLSSASLDAIDEALGGGNQVLVFLNRRGFAPAYECQQCRWVATCPNCSCRLTAHRQYQKLLCHQCAFERPIPRQCDQCQSQRLKMSGVGTERLEDFLQRRYPNFPVLRIDRDSTQRRGARKGLLESAARGAPGILVGTQMLAKGHHFPAVTLAIMLGIDQGLLSADPWALEQTAQLCIQVAGRAGRGDRSGRALLETTMPDHPLIRQLTEQGYESVAATLLQQRLSANLPPYGYWALIRAEHGDFQVCEKLLGDVAAGLRQHSVAGQILGPIPCLLERRGNRFRYQLQIHTNARSSLHELTDLAVRHLDQTAAKTKARWSVDVDPLGLD